MGLYQPLSPVLVNFPDHRQEAEKDLYPAIYPLPAIWRILRFFLTSYTMSHTVCVVHYMSQSTDNNERFENLRLELRRGCLSLAVLSQLKTERYGYTLRKALNEQGMEIDEGTLYPLLRRLESQGLLTSEWREEDKREKRFYRLSAEGRKVLSQLLEEWRELNASLDRIV